MTGLKIVGLLVLAGLSVLIYTLWPSSADVNRRYDAIAPERERTELAFAESAEHIRHFNERLSQPLNAKKKELGALRRRAEALEIDAKNSRDDESIDRVEANRSLERLAEEFIDLRIDAEDLLARLRQMKLFVLLLNPLRAANARLTIQLRRVAGQSTDPDFAQRVQTLLDESEKLLRVAASGEARLKLEIGQGRQIAESGRLGLIDVDRSLRELIEEAGETPDAAPVRQPELAPRELSELEAWLAEQ